MKKSARECMNESEWGATRVRGESWYELVELGGRGVDGCHGTPARFKGRPSIGINDKMRYGTVASLSYRVRRYIVQDSVLDAPFSTGGLVGWRQFGQGINGQRVVDTSLTLGGGGGAGS